MGVPVGVGGTVVRDGIPRRRGGPPVVPDVRPLEQLTQNAPVRLQESLLRLAGSMRGVLIGTSTGCTPGSSGLHLAPKLAQGPRWAFLGGTEFAHLHPSYDGSLHVTLPPLVSSAVEAAGWGKQDSPLGACLLYGPRDEDELQFVWELLTCSYRYARSLPLPWGRGRRRHNR